MTNRQVPYYRYYIRIVTKQGDYSYLYLAKYEDDILSVRPKFIEDDDILYSEVTKVAYMSDEWDDIPILYNSTARIKLTNGCYLI